MCTIFKICFQLNLGKLKKYIKYDNHNCTLSLLLVAYLFDLTASRTQIPSVILLLVLGWFVRETTYY
jgi:hypothetical protein